MPHSRYPNKLISQINTYSMYINNSEFEEVLLQFETLRKQIGKYQCILGDLQESQTVKPNQLRGELIKDFSTKLEKSEVKMRQIKNDLGIFFYKISEGLTKYANFCMESEDLIQEGILQCYIKMDRFSPEKGKAFNYFTSLIFNHYRQKYRNKKQYERLKWRYLQAQEHGIL
ncbi:MAG: hypothetical protein K2X29_05435 [Candidatus Obscuribacterales bacterium]|nr:hypothetical protein [Candidatus Obscuribacterales bacterium]